MENLRREIRRILSLYGFRPRRKLGQNFMVDRSLMERMADYAELGLKDRVLEVGAGLGFLTEVLAEKAGEVLAVESDRRLYQYLTRKFSGKSNVRLLFGDFLKLRVEGQYDKVVSNPPYSISSQLIFKILESPFKVAVLTLQKEFAERIMARPGSRNYGRLTVMVDFRAEAEILEKVSREAFYPEPEVDSVIVRLKPKIKPPYEVENLEFFSETVKLLFTQRRRKLGRALQTLAKLKPEIGLKKPFNNIPYVERRVFTLTPEEFAEVANVLWRLKS